MLKVQYRTELNKNMNIFHHSLVLAFCFCITQLVLIKGGFMFLTHNPRECKSFPLYIDFCQVNTSPITNFNQNVLCIYKIHRQSIQSFFRNGSWKPEVANLIDGFETQGWGSGKPIGTVSPYTCNWNRTVSLLQVWMEFCHTR